MSSCFFLIETKSEKLYFEIVHDLPLKSICKKLDYVFFALVLHKFMLNKQPFLIKLKQRQ